jgi:ligand-binding sensor domain-containing protein
VIDFQNRESRMRALPTAVNSYFYLAKRFSFFLVTLLSLFSSTASSQDDYSVHTFTVGDSLAQDYIYSIVQDARGFLWVGTGMGLSRYDGKNIHNFRSAQGLAGNFITSSARDANGNIYFGHLEGTITLFDGFSFFSISGTIKGKVTGVAFDELRNVVWAVYQNGQVLCIKNKAAKQMHHNILDEKICNGIESNRYGILIATNENLSILKINNENEIISVFTDEKLSNTNVTSFYKSKDRKRIWIGTEEQGVYRLDNDNDVMNAGVVTKLFDLNFDPYFITGLLQDSNGDLWISTRLTGLIKVMLDKSSYKSVDITYFKGEGMLRSPSILFEDQEHSIWAGSLGEGLKQYVHNQFDFFDLKKKMGVEEILAGIQLSLYEYWIATNQGIVLLKYDANSKEYLFSNHPNAEVSAIKAKHLYYQANDSIVWIEAEGKGVHIFNKLSNKVFVIKGLEKSKFSDVAKDNLGNTWMALETEGVCMLDLQLKIVKRYSTSNGLLHNNISAICVDRKNNVWFGSEATGLFRLRQDGKFEYWTKDGRFPSYSITDIEEDEQGNIWVATDGDGIMKIENDSIQVLTENSGLLSNFARQLICDKRKNIWIVHRKGISKLSLSHQGAIKVFDGSQGIGGITNENSLFFQDVAEDIWSAQGSTLVKYNRSLEDVIPFLKKAFVTDIRLFYKKENLIPYTAKKEKAGSVYDQIELPHDKNHLTFDFISVSLRDRNSVYYRHRLEGFESEWSPPSLENTATYTNLSPGDYAILISASDNPNAWTDDHVRYSVTIMKPYWELWWFYLLQILVILILFYITYYFSKTSSDKKVSQSILRLMVYILLFIIFEYIIIFLEPYTKNFENGAPVASVIINLVLALILLPIEDYSKKFFRVE